MANLSNINDKFLVTTGGNVLIGQTSAIGSSIFQVTGNSTFAGNVTANVGTFNSDSGGTGLKIIGRSAANSGALRYYQNNGTTQTARIESNDSIFEINSISNLPIELKTNDTLALTLDTSQNATFAGMITVNGGGIDIDNNDDVRLRFDNASVFKAGLQVATTAGDMIAGSAVNDFAIRAQENMLFATGGNTEIMRITSAGNVGIGTAGYAQKRLDVSGPTGAQVLITGDSDDVGTTAGIMFRSEASEENGLARVKGGIFFERIAGSFGNGKLKFAVNGSVNNNTVAVTDVAMTIDNNKNVGIGTTSPSEKLTVDAQSADGVTTTIASFHSNEGESGDTAIQLAVRRSDSLGSDRKTFLNATGAGNFEIQRSGSTKVTISGTGDVGITAAAYLGFNGAGDASHSVAYNAGIDGVQLRGQNGVILGTGGGATAIERMRIDQNGQMTYQGAEPGTTGIRFQGSGTCNGYAGSLLNFYAMDVMRDQGSGKAMNVQGTIDIAAGYGIGFGASAGGGATSTLLDDYEEGTWTPVAYASNGTATGSYSQQLGTYTKIGRQVTCMFDFQVTLSGTMVGFAGISGLPFTVGNSSASGGGMAGYSVNQFRSSSLFAASTTGKQISGFPQQNASYMYCQLDNSGVNGFAGASAAAWNIGTSGRCTGFVIYFTD